jgi:pheromone shutdown-related protein TraB
MLEGIERIQTDDREIILVGTAHVSKESVELVKKTIDSEEPDIVGVELCEQRHETILNKKTWDDTELTKVIREGKGYLFLINLLLANFQRKIGDELGVQPGSEMMEALKIAREKNISVALLDRDIQITLKRAWGIMPLPEKIRLFFYLFYDFTYGVFEGKKINENLIEELKDKDVISELMNELGKEAPSVKKVLVDERDIYIANKILTAKGKKVVAVIGAGHVSGIKKYIETHITEKKPYDLKQLEEIPKKAGIMKFAKYIIPVIFILILWYGFKTGGYEKVINMLAIWIICHVIFAGIGAALARAHPYTIITSALVSSVTSLRLVVLPAGFFAAIVESHVRKPTVKDFEGITKLTSIRDAWKNNVTRILLVFIFSDFGSSTGSFIAFWYMAQAVI